MNKTVFYEATHPKVKRMNVRMLTEVRENFLTERGITSAFRIGNIKPIALKKKQSALGKNSKRNACSNKSICRKIGDWLPASYDQATFERIQLIKEQIFQGFNLDMTSNVHSCLSKLSLIFEIGENINENLYNYLKIEKKIKRINEKVKELYSPSLQFYCFSISGLMLFQYGSFSLTIFYFDKALKALNGNKNHHFNSKLQLQLYRTIAKVFMQIGQYSQARDMAYMYLRKSWLNKNIDEQMNAYDLLGQIELEQGNLDMSRYFHWRMCHGSQQSHQIVTMSNNELQKNSKEHLQLAVYEDITMFVKRQRPIISILANHYRSQAQQELKDIGPRTRNLLLYTHRSPNRVLRNHRFLQRKLIDQKESGELHFIRPKDIKKLRKYITEFSSFVFDLRRKCEIDHLRHKASSFLKDPSKI